MSDPFNQSAPPPNLPGSLGPVQTGIAQRGVFKPQLGGFVIVDLPGEKTRAEIVAVYGDNVVVARLGMLMMSGKNHQYMPKQEIAVRREVDEGVGGEIWRVINEHEIKAAENANRLAREQVFREAAARRQEPPPLETQPAVRPAHKDDGLGDDFWQ